MFVFLYYSLLFHPDIIPNIINNVDLKSMKEHIKCVLTSWPMHGQYLKKYIL